jgi:integrase
MAMKYQKGTVYLRGEKVKMWYGKFLMYGRDQEGKEVKKHRNVAICKKAEAPKWKAEQILREIILRETGGTGVKPTLIPDETLTFRWFVQQRYIPMRQGSWSPAYRKTNTYQLDHYLVSVFGDLPLSRLDTFQFQIFLNGLAEKGYSEAVVGQCFNNIRAITKLAKKQKYLSEDPGEDIKMPQTKSAEKPVMLREQILSLIGAVTDLHDLCLFYIGIFCGPRSSEVFGFQWASWNGESLTPLGTTFEGQFYVGRTKPNRVKRRSRYRSRFVRSSRPGRRSAPTCHPRP